MSATIRMGGGRGPRTPAEPEAVTQALGPGPVARTAHECPACAAVYSGTARFCAFDGEPLRALPTWSPGDDPMIGREIGGRYRIEAVLGEGGMGKVYAARHVTIDKPCAIKVLRREVAAEGEATERFLQEAKLTAALSHPNVVAVSDFGELADPLDAAVRIPWFAMERLQGETLAQRLRRDGPLPTALAARIGRECAEGLAVAHAKGIVHRDLKPDNVFLATAESGRTVAKLLDFGVAKVAGASKRTRKGMTFGTPHYMSPEQATGGTLDGRADLYALGIILYECLAGSVPFQADTFMGVLTKHVYETPEPLERVVDPDTLGELGAIVARCLAKRPEERWEDATTLAAALQAAEGEEGARISPRSERVRGAAAAARKEHLRAVLSKPPADRELPAVGAPRAGQRLRTVALALLAGVATLLAVVVAARWRGEAPARPSSSPAGALPAASPRGEGTAPPAEPPARAPVAAAVPSLAPVAPAPVATGRRPSPVPRPEASPSRPPPAPAGRDRGELVDPWND